MNAPLRIPRGLHIDQLGPIGRLLRGRFLHDVVSIPDGLLIRCTDGLEVEVAFASTGAELKMFRSGVITRDVTMPQALRFMRGRVLDHAFWDPRLAEFIVLALDGHALRFEWASGQPEARGVDVFVDVPPAPTFGAAGQL